MNRSALASVLLSLLIPVGAIAQNPPTPGSPPVQQQQLPRRAVILPTAGNIQAPPPQEEALTRNYQVRLNVKNGESTTEFSILSASPKVSLMGAGVKATEGRFPAVNLSGTLYEFEQGKLMFSYSLLARVPVLAGVTQEGKQHYEWVDEQGTGVLHLAPGKAYELLKCGERAYSVTITPAEEDGH